MMMVEVGGKIINSVDDGIVVQRIVALGKHTMQWLRVREIQSCGTQTGETGGDRR